MPEARQAGCRRFALWVLGAAAVALGGCSGPPPRDATPPGYQVDPDSVPDAVPRREPRSRYGNPPSYKVLGRVYHTRSDSKGYIERGIASWYGPKFHGKRTSSGEPYDMYAMTAAHKSLPLPSYVQVTNLDNGRRVTLRVNDRGPFHANRLIDVSYTAAAKLGMIRRGTALVEVRAIDVGAPTPAVYHPPSATIARLFVQAGAFEQRENARRMHGRLQGLVPDPIVVSPAQVHGRQLFRVRIGPLSDARDADRVVGALQRAGVAETRILIE